jgi:hypothetical protein
VAGSTVGELNYPTMAAQVEPGQNFTVGFPRTATNVGDDGGAVYDVKVVFAVGAAADLIAVAISPSRLEFSERNAKFTVTVAGVAAWRQAWAVSSRRPSCGPTASTGQEPCGGVRTHRTLWEITLV